MTVLFVAKIYCWTIKQVHKPLHQHNVDSGKGSTRRAISGNQRYQSHHALIFQNYLSVSSESDCSESD